MTNTEKELLDCLKDYIKQTEMAMVQEGVWFNKVYKDARILVKNLTIPDVSSSFKVGTYTIIKKGESEYSHWSKGLKMVLEKDGVVMKLESEDIKKIVKSLPRTIEGTY